MEDHTLTKSQTNLKLADFLQTQLIGRENLGGEIPVSVHRLLEYSLHEELTEQFGKKTDSYLPKRRFPSRTIFCK